jgi:hypothetical protein
MVECGKKMQDSTLWLMNQYRSLQERSCGVSGFRREVDETAIFWAIMQRVVVYPYRRFGTTYRSHLDIRTLSTGTALAITDSRLHLPLHFIHKKMTGRNNCQLFSFYGQTPIPLLLLTCISNAFFLSVPKMTHKSLQSKMETLKKLALLFLSKLPRAKRS